MPPRRDLELEALAEIVRGERLIHCHSYRQDEILMLARLANQFGITLGTFQHVLEGYKVAEAITTSALGASTFADWWAYKFEVIDAIPHNAAIMSEVGVCVSINSDSSEHARRLNTEAGKAVKYGGMDPHEALKLVTLNPAIQLGVADRIGSLEVGKDADFVVWSGDPLSYASRCESTWIDGREYFSLERDAELRAQAESERQRILQKLMREESGGRGGGRGGRRGGPELIDRPTWTDRGHVEELEELYRAGLDPTLPRPGDCGCGASTWFHLEHAGEER
jgi:N-acetylglucosamine-6-phosphate deacetylase